MIKRDTGYLNSQICAPLGDGFKMASLLSKCPGQRLHTSTTSEWLPITDVSHVQLLGGSAFHTLHKFLVSNNHKLNSQLPSKKTCPGAKSASCSLLRLPLLVKPQIHRKSPMNHHITRALLHAHSLKYATINHLFGA